MSVTLPSAREVMEVGWWWEQPTDGRRLTFTDHSAAMTFLRRLSGHAGNTLTLRRFAAEQLPARTWSIEDASLLEQLARWLVAGRIQIAARPRPPLSVTLLDREEEAAAAIPWDAPQPSTPAPSAPKEAPTFPPDIDAVAIAAAKREAARLGVPFCEECMKKRLTRERAAKSDVAAEQTWVEISLIGEDGSPIPGARYRIQLPDGSVREGALDAAGLCRIDAIDPGSCVVTFPDLDQDAWVKA
jgi:hypothetical protein